MKKIKKGYVFSFILGAIIFGSIVGVSAYTIFADNIGYTPKDTTWKKANGEDIENVKDALDELYNKAVNFSSMQVIAYDDNVSNGTVINVEVGSLIIVTSLGSMNATNAEAIIEHLWGDTYAGLGTRTSVYKATDTSVRLSCDRTMSYIVINN